MRPVAAMITEDIPCICASGAGEVYRYFEFPAEQYQDFLMPNPAAATS